LRKEGYQVATASNGAEGLLLVEEENLDLIILGIMIPKMDGFEICRRLREWMQAPIINAEMGMKSAHGEGNFLIKTEKIENTIKISFKDD